MCDIHRGKSDPGLCEGEELVADAPYAGDLFLDKLIGLQGSQVFLMSTLFVDYYLAHALKGFLILELLVRCLPVD